MNKKKFMGVILLGFLTIIAATQMVTAVNQYSVEVGAHFRWDATKYIFVKDGMGPGNDIEYTHTYYLEFEFTNWAGLSGAEYLNGTINVNGTVYTGEISYEYYYSRVPGGNVWGTDILDVSVALYPIRIYLVSNTEIEQNTKPDLQNAATHPDLTFNEISTYNYSLTGSFSAPEGTYSGRIEFNSDKVLKYVYDESILKTDEDIQRIDRYVWTLTYTPGTSTGGNGGSIPGFSLYYVMGAIAISFLFLLRRKNLLKIRIN